LTLPDRGTGNTPPQITEMFFFLDICVNLRHLRADRAGGQIQNPGSSISYRVGGGGVDRLRFWE
jgi:hypothetical protein